MEEEECLMMIPVSSSSSSPFFGLYHQRQQTKNVPSPTTTTTTTNNSSSNNKQRRNNRQHIIKVGFMIVIISCFLSFLLFVQNSWVWKHRVIIPSRTSISFKNNNNNNNETTEEKRSKDEDDDNTTTTTNNNNNKIGLVSYCFGEKFIKLRELVRYNHQIYASHHDNVYIFEGNSTTMPYESFITPPAWLKVAYLYQLLSSSSSSSLRSSSSVTTNDDDPSSLNNIEWFVWIDCDAIIARYDISIESLLFTNNNNKQLNNINVQPYHHIVVADDKPVDSPFNTGVMFVRNCLWSKQFFQRALQLSSNDTIRYHKWWEQKAFSELYLNNLHNEQSHVYVVRNGRSIFNGFAGMNKPYQPSYIDNTTFIWHRVHCNTTTTTTTTAINKKNEHDYYENDCCFNFSISFFCSKTPSPSNDNNNNNGKIYSFYPKNYCKGIPPWEPPSKTNHC